MWRKDYFISVIVLSITALLISCSNDKDSPTAPTSEKTTQFLFLEVTSDVTSEYVSGAIDTTKIQRSYLDSSVDFEFTQENKELTYWDYDELLFSYPIEIISGSKISVITPSMKGTQGHLIIIAPRADDRPVFLDATGAVQFLNVNEEDEISVYLKNGVTFDLPKDSLFTIQFNDYEELVDTNMDTAYVKLMYDISVKNHGYVKTENAHWIKLEW